MSTDFKKGDRVRVEFDAVVVSLLPWGRVGTKAEGGDLVVAPRAFVTKYDPPVKVGDVLTDKDAEPSVGTIVYTSDAHPSSWQHDGDGRWYPSNPRWGSDSWSFVGGAFDGATVTHLPDAE